ncbi:MAG TPA: HesA/MoeB/ThiF family protein [bacterium]|nr:HesA/MoeB/ThiF family protein [bacterium]
MSASTTLSVAAATNRHRRQKLLEWLDEEGQDRLARSTVLIARTGGLGGPLAQSLAVAGVGRIVLFHEGELLDEDLHRMILMDPRGVGLPRAPQAVETLRRLGRPELRVEGFAHRISPDEAADWMREADLAVGAAPTYEERLTLNDAALAAGKPFVDAAMYADETHVLCVKPGETACLRCLVPDPPPWRPDFPVLAAVSALVGNLAASLCIRILAARGHVPWGELVHLDVDRLELTKVRLPRRAECSACAAVPSGASR